MQQVCNNKIILCFVIVIAMFLLLSKTKEESSFNHSMRTRRKNNFNDQYYDQKAEFVPSQFFTGAMAGYVFKNDEGKIGYHKDKKAETRQP